MSTTEKTTFAKNAVLQKTGSHWINDDNSTRADGISKEEVYLYFSAEWRSQPVQVDVSADRYTHSEGMSEWRVYARAARFHDPERNGGRGEETTGAARSALSQLCKPMATEWLDSPAYRLSFQRALAHMIMRKFRDDYSAGRQVNAALGTFKDRLSPDAYQAIRRTLEAYNAYSVAQAHANAVISEDQS